MKLRRDILLFAAVALAAIAGGWWLLANRTGGAIAAFQRDQAARNEAARGQLPPANAFRATVCADAPCVVVEAGGLTFILGAGSGAAEGIQSRALMHANVDALLLPDLALNTVEGLPAIALASARAGRREPLKVYGPAGLVPVIDGANLMLSGAARLAAGTEGEDQGLAGRVIFDSGVVAIRGFGGRETASGRVFRIDFDERSLILAGCLAQPADILAAARGVQTSAAVLMAGSTTLIGDSNACLDLPEALRAAGQGRVATALIVPINPSPHLPGAKPAWTDAFAAQNPVAAQLGFEGARIDLTGDKPRTTPAP